MYPPMKMSSKCDKMNVIQLFLVSPLYCVIM